MSTTLAPEVPDTIADLDLGPPDDDVIHLRCDWCNSPERCRREGRRIVTLCGVTFDPWLNEGNPDPEAATCPACKREIPEHTRRCWSRDA